MKSGKSLTNKLFGFEDKKNEMKKCDQKTIKEENEDDFLKNNVVYQLSNSFDLLVEIANQDLEYFEKYPKLPPLDNSMTPEKINEFIIAVEEKKAKFLEEGLEGKISCEMVKNLKKSLEDYREYFIKRKCQVENYETFCKEKQKCVLQNKTDCYLKPEQLKKYSSQNLHCYLKPSEYYEEPIKQCEHQEQNQSHQPNQFEPIQPEECEIKRVLEAQDLHGKNPIEQEPQRHSNDPPPERLELLESHRECQKNYELLKQCEQSEFQRKAIKEKKCEFQPQIYPSNKNQCINKIAKKEIKNPLMKTLHDLINLRIDYHFKKIEEVTKDSNGEETLTTTLINLENTAENNLKYIKSFDTEKILKYHFLYIHYHLLKQKEVDSLRNKPEDLNKNIKS